MANIFDKLGQTLFGKEGKTAPSSVASFQQPYLTDLFQRAKEFSLGPSISPTEQQAQQQALNYAGTLSPFIGGTQSANQFLTSPGILSPYSNPYLMQTAEAATRPVLQSLTESILPSIRGEAVGAGGYGGSRQGIAEGIAGRGALQSIGDLMAKIFSGAYGQGLGALQQGISLAPQTASLGLLPSQIEQAIGEQQRLAPFEQLQRYQSLLGPSIVTGGGGTTGKQGVLSINLGGSFGG